MSGTPHADALSHEIDPLTLIMSRIDDAAVTLTQLRQILDAPCMQWPKGTSEHASADLSDMEQNRWNWCTDYIGNMLQNMSMAVEMAQMEDNPEAMHIQARAGLASAKKTYEHRNGEFTALREYLRDAVPSQLGLDAESRDQALSLLHKLEAEKNKVIEPVTAYIDTGKIPTQPQQGR